MQQFAESPHALRQALGIVETVHADQQFAARILLLHPLVHVSAFGGVGERLEFGDVDADRKRAGLDRPVEGAPTAVADQLGMGFGLRVSAEVGDVRVALEAQQVIGEQRADQPVVTGDRRQDQGRRQRDVQEETDPVGAAQRAQFSGERDQVIVVHPQNVVFLQQRQQLASEQLVDAPVARDVAGVEVGEVEPVMEDRPEHAVGVARVVGVVILA